MDVFGVLPKSWGDKTRVVIEDGGKTFERLSRFAKIPGRQNSSWYKMAAKRLNAFRVLPNPGAAKLEFIQGGCKNV